MSGSGLLIPSPWFTALDGNGVVIPSAKIYTYLAGSDTAAATYQDADLETVHANPIVCDLSGRATIYIPPTSAYKFVLKTSAGVLVRETDNVVAVGFTDAMVEAMVCWPGSDSAAIVGAAYQAGTTKAVRASGTAFLEITIGCRAIFEATLWVESGGIAFVGLFSTAIPNTPWVELSSLSADGELVSAEVTLNPTTYFIKAHSFSSTKQAFAVCYRLRPVLPTTAA